MYIAISLQLLLLMIYTPGAARRASAGGVSDESTAQAEAAPAIFLCLIARGAQV